MYYVIRAYAANTYTYVPWKISTVGWNISTNRNRLKSSPFLFFAWPVFCAWPVFASKVLPDSAKKTWCFFVCSPFHGCFCACFALNQDMYFQKLKMWVGMNPKPRFWKNKQTNNFCFFYSAFFNTAQTIPRVLYVKYVCKVAPVDSHPPSIKVRCPQHCQHLATQLRRGPPSVRLLQAVWREQRNLLMVNQ